MKNVLPSLLFCLLSFSVTAQDKPTVIPDGTKQAAAVAMVEKGYTTASGWTIRPGDEIKIGKGSMPNKTFAFIYQSPVGYFSETSMDNYSNKHYAPTSAAGKTVKVKGVSVYGTKKSGYTVIAKIGLGAMVNYWVEIDNAIDGGEVIPPDRFLKKEPQTDKAPTSVADELKKLKELLDAGAITQSEYDAQKKKLLEQ